MDSTNSQQAPHREWQGTHHSWNYRCEAFRWIGNQVAGVNILPLAGELHSWLLRNGQLSIPPMEDEPGGFTNPFTFSGSALNLIMSRVVTATHDFSSLPSGRLEGIDAEIERLRLYNETVLYVARICEVSIKQLLFCSAIPEARYRPMALGALLESHCPSCKKSNGAIPHLVSLVGTLAHPFKLCFEFENCAMDHMSFANKLRNRNSAHSELGKLDIRTETESKDELSKDIRNLLPGFVHMLSHLATLENEMLSDLNKKMNAINLLKLGSLRAGSINLELTPGSPANFKLATVATLSESPTKKLG